MLLRKASKEETKEVKLEITDIEESLTFSNERVTKPDKDIKQELKTQDGKIKKSVKMWMGKTLLTEKHKINYNILFYGVR
ncbi:hypothetical protein CHS0354_034836 [Potamilus streckersoni]|uniref:Uncharacterized protein n=1 Tax=Potamilus streckersoni TaxID=2493646 RepID=A0AAE0TK46_9BIVA|nr:hypothetical protein CHS0354_034836 [Potamilus streckersoni]